MKPKELKTKISHAQSLSLCHFSLCHSLSHTLTLPIYSHPTSLSLSSATGLSSCTKELVPKPAISDTLDRDTTAEKSYQPGGKEIPHSGSQSMTEQLVSSQAESPTLTGLALSLSLTLSLSLILSLSLSLSVFHTLILSHSLSLPIHSHSVSHSLCHSLRLSHSHTLYLCLPLTLSHSHPVSLALCFTLTSHSHLHSVSLSLLILTLFHSHSVSLSLLILSTGIFRTEFRGCEDSHDETRLDSLMDTDSLMDFITHAETELESERQCAEVLLPSLLLLALLVLSSLLLPCVLLLALLLPSLLSAAAVICCCRLCWCWLYCPHCVLSLRCLTLVCILGSLSAVFS